MVVTLEKHPRGYIIAVSNAHVSYRVGYDLRKERLFGHPQAVASAIRGEARERIRDALAWEMMNKAA